MLTILFGYRERAGAQNQVPPEGNAYVSYEADGNKIAQIFIQEFNGTKRFITNSSDHNYNPQWNSSGEKIIFYRKDSEQPLSKLVLYDQKTNAESIILESGFYHGDPSISNDNVSVAFTSKRDGDCDIYLLDLESEKVKPLVSNTSNNWGPSWSPDNDRLVFTSDMNGNFELYTVNADSSGLAQLTNLRGENYKPDWSPDGRRIAFFHRDNAKSKFDVFIVSSDGRNIQNVTNTSDEDEYTCCWTSQRLFYYAPEGIRRYNLKKEKSELILSSNE